VGGKAGCLAVAAELHLGRADLVPREGVHGQVGTLVVGDEDGAARAEGGAVGRAQSTGEGTVREGVEFRGRRVPDEDGAGVEGGSVQGGGTVAAGGVASVSRVEFALVIDRGEDVMVGLRVRAGAR